VRLYCFKIFHNTLNSEFQNVNIGMWSWVAAGSGLFPYAIESR
jgi:hypothetical protein